MIINTINMKKCNKCNKMQVMSEYYRASNHKDGRKTICKECDRRRVLARRKKCPDCSKQINRTSTRCGSCSQRSSLNRRWLGDKVGYGGLHKWIKRRKPKPETCQICEEKPPKDLANISQQYKRDIDDFWWLCRSCHLNYDIACGVRGKGGSK